MSYDNEKKAFDKTAKRIVEASKGQLTHRQAADRLRKAIQKEQNKR